MQEVKAATIEELTRAVNEKLKSGMHPFLGVEHDGTDFYQMVVPSDTWILSTGMFDRGFDPDTPSYEVVAAGTPLTNQRPYVGVQRGNQVYTTARFSALTSHLSYVDTTNERAQQLAKDAYVKMVKFLNA